MYLSVIQLVGMAFIIMTYINGLPANRKAAYRARKIKQKLRLALQRMAEEEKAKRLAVREDKTADAASSLLFSKKPAKIVRSWPGRCQEPSEGIAFRAGKALQPVWRRLRRRRVAAR